MFKLKFIISVVLMAAMLSSCNKDYLNDNPRTDLLTPTDFKALHALLDNDRVMNLHPTLGEISSDNYYLTFQYWQALPLRTERFSYTWEKNIYNGQLNADDWSRSYSQVLYANVALFGLTQIPVVGSNRDEWEAIKGNALFFRAHAWYNLAQIFAPAYDNATAATDLGIPLRTLEDVSQSFPRATVQQTYDSILADLQNAEELVSVNVQYLNKNRPSKPAVLALTARVYLSMRNYELAGEYANRALQLHDSLMDYNLANQFTPLPFDVKNKETIFQARFNNEGTVLASIIYPEVIVDSSLFNMYAPSDLRQSLYYTKMFNVNGQFNLKGTYSGSIYPFTGIATDELYLIRAEANAFANNISAAMNDLNTLLATRYVTGTFTPLTASTREEALDLIRTERRKELAYRGHRWTDLRRFNKEGANITLQRVLNGTQYTLLPNSKLYVLPIPPEVISLSGIPNNER